MFGMLRSTCNNLSPSHKDTKDSYRKKIGLYPALFKYNILFCLSENFVFIEDSFGEKLDLVGVKIARQSKSKQYNLMQARL